MPTFTTNLDKETWFDQKPSHRGMDAREIAARQAENIAWDMADEYLTRLHENGIGDYETYNTLRVMAENASESLRAIKHQIDIGQ